ncbi:hypothetical protein PRUB_b0545 [Pseudoalteromonas rubra]|uniref:Uncharacterized protein n=1 Tax=Pseudoalteromonas rubra TaxID=43658 RepID=A0A8T0BZZ0_9GAMM|nr:hypothetical protein [Pseudoalteromonas rubra]KAF7781355.1 hypothetical protein PRUB_b0545 [Pseudoalteromonas rubra]
MVARWHTVKISVLIIALAMLDLIFTLLGVWSVVGETRNWVLSFEALTLILLLCNCLIIRQVINQHQYAHSYRLVANLVVFSLLFCLAGDIVNFNLAQHYFQHGAVIKHDYLADSVWFFMPGYLLLFLACWCLLGYSGTQVVYFIIAMLITSLLALFSYLNMHLPGSGWYVTLLTGGYALVIAQAALLGLCLLISSRIAKTQRTILALGMILATVADALIGQFWLFGNEGQGYYPQIRAINWAIYITSQAIVIHLPLVAITQAQTSSRTSAAEAGLAK